MKFLFSEELGTTKDAAFAASIISNREMTAGARPGDCGRLLGEVSVHARSLGIFEQDGTVAYKTESLDRMGRPSGAPPRQILSNELISNLVDKLQH